MDIKQEPQHLAGRLNMGVAVLAAGLGGFGVILWLAANWDAFGRFAQFALLQTGVLAAGLVAWWRMGLRSSMGLLGFMCSGGLLAFFGQTYQTGADPWQLFALWAALALPLCLGARSDVLWTPWALVAMTAIVLWEHAHNTRNWIWESGYWPIQLAAWCMALTVCAVLSPAWRRWTGAGLWAWRLGCTQTVAGITMSAAMALFATESALYPLALVLLGGAVLLYIQRRFFDLYMLCVVALGLNILLVFGLSWQLFHDNSDSLFFGKMLLVGVVAMGLMGGSVALILRNMRAPGSQPEVAPAEHRARPWPVLVLTALGAWLAVVPLLFAVGWMLDNMLSDSSITRGILGLALVTASVWVLRSSLHRLFVEQLLFPCLIVGTLLVTSMLVDYMKWGYGFAMASLLVLGMATLLPQAWLRILSGVTAALFAGVALFNAWKLMPGIPAVKSWMILHLLLLAWLAVAMLAFKALPSAKTARLAGLAETTGVGWLVVVLAGMAAWSGMTFLLGSGLGRMPAEIATGSAADLRGVLVGARVFCSLCSVTLSLAGAGWLWQRWPALRRPWYPGMALVLAGLAWVMPTLGATLLVLALCAGTRRWRMACAAAVAAVWIVGAFYYTLSLPLATKAAILVASAGVLAGLAVWGLKDTRRLNAPTTPGTPPPGQEADKPRAPAMPQRFSRWSIATGIALVLVVANIGIWQKEQLIRNGQAVFVPLMPTDPRSLMQGDYMRLRFLSRTTARGAEPESAAERVSFDGPRMVFQRDAQGILSLIGSDDNKPLAKDQVAIELVPRNGEWVLVTDAFYFKEGEAERWAKARFGEFRVDSSGKALLVGLRGENLQPL